MPVIISLLRQYNRILLFHKVASELHMHGIPIVIAIGMDIASAYT